MSNSSDLMDLLFAGARQRVLAILLLNPGEDFHVRELARQVGVNAGTLNRELAKLEATGIIRASDVGNQKRYQANAQHFLHDDLAAMFRKTHGAAAAIREAIERVDQDIDVAWIFGSVARGTETRWSDVDLFVVGNVDFVGMSEALFPVQLSLNREINPVYYTREEMLSRLQAKNNFVRNVIESPKIFVKGSSDDITKLIEDSALAIA